jgi:hypothetical protein
VVVLLVLLSVVLLAGLLGLAVQHKTVMEKNVCMGRDVEQLVQRLKNVTEQHKTVSMEVEQLLQRLKNVTEQKDSLLMKQDCPGGWDKFGFKCYQVTRARGSWKKIRELCVSKGADLVVLESKEEMDFISRYGGNIWLGAKYETSKRLLELNPDGNVSGMLFLFLLVRGELKRAALSLRIL